MPDSADVRLDTAAGYFQEGEYAAAVSALQEAVCLLSREGAEVVSSLSAADFTSPVFLAVRRVFSVFDGLPDSAGISSLMPEAGHLLPDACASPSEMLAAVTEIYEQAEEDGEDTDAEEDTDAVLSLVRILTGLLSGQQSMRELIFSEDGLYGSAALAAVPYLTGFFVFSGDDTDSSIKKADRVLFGPLKRLAELFYSLLTSSLTAGLLLLAVRRAIPVLRPSRASTAANAVYLAAVNIPVLLDGLRSVARELSLLRQIIRGEDAGDGNA